jgi:hypothetical protein
MEIYRRRPDVLWNALLDMGVTLEGDGLPEEQ